jgi:hypothetical protein
MPGLGGLRGPLLGFGVRPAAVRRTASGEKSSECSFGASGSGLESGESSKLYPLRPPASGVAWMRYVLSRTRCRTGFEGCLSVLRAVDGLRCDGGGKMDVPGVMASGPPRFGVLLGVVGGASCIRDKKAVDGESSSSSSRFGEGLITSCDSLLENEDGRGVLWDGESDRVDRSGSSSRGRRSRCSEDGVAYDSDSSSSCECVPVTVSSSVKVVFWPLSLGGCSS